MIADDILLDQGIQSILMSPKQNLRIINFFPTIFRINLKARLAFGGL